VEAKWRRRGGEGEAKGRRLGLSRVSLSHWAKVNPIGAAAAATATATTVEFSGLTERERERERLRVCVCVWLDQLFRKFRLTDFSEVRD
jgi:hypothetical protein